MLRVKSSSADHSLCIYNVYIDIHALLLINNFERRGSARRTYYCYIFSIVHVETYSCSVVSVAVLSKTVTHLFFLLRA